MLLPPGYADRLLPTFPHPELPNRFTVSTATEILPGHVRLALRGPDRRLYVYWVAKVIAEAHLTDAARGNIMNGIAHAIISSYDFQQTFVELERAFVILLTAAATAGAGMPADMLTPHSGVTAVFSILDGDLFNVCCAPDGLTRISFRLFASLREEDLMIEWALEGCNAAITSTSLLDSGMWSLHDLRAGRVPKQLERATSLLAAAYAPVE